VADPQQGVSVHAGDGTGSRGSVKRCGKREWEARFRQEEGREQGTIAQMSLRRALQREQNPSSFAPPPHPTLNNGFKEVPLKLYVD